MKYEFYVLNIGYWFMIALWTSFRDLAEDCCRATCFMAVCIPSRLVSWVSMEFVCITFWS